MKKELIVLLGLLILGLLGCQALLAPDFYTSHDGETHAARITNYYLALRDGQLPVRWAPNLNAGAGSPMFVFLYPLPYFLAALVHFWEVSFVDSFKLVLGIFYVLSGVTFYLWARSYTSRPAAFLGAVFFMWAPYRFSQLFVRAAFAESIAYAFIPLVFLSFGKLREKATSRWLAVGAVSVGGLMLSHNLVAFIFLPLALLYVFVPVILARKLSAISYPLFALALGAGLSAFIYIPDLAEIGYLRFSGLINYYHEHLVYFWQFFRSPWDYGFSFKGESDGMSFQLGWAQVSTTLLVIGLLVLGRIEEKSRTAAVFFLVVFFAAAMLMLESPVARFLWGKLPGLTTVDYPWRLLGVTVFSGAALASLAAFNIRSYIGRMIVVGFLFGLVLVANRNHLRVNQKVILTDDQLLSYSGSATHLGEFTPRTRMNTKTKVLPEKVFVTAGEAQVQTEIFRSNYQDYRVTAKTPARVQINTFYFPGWQVTLDGKLLEFNKDWQVTNWLDLKTDTDMSGMIAVDVSPGNHRIELRFGETMVRLLANLISLFALAVVLSLSLATLSGRMFSQANEK